MTTGFPYCKKRGIKQKKWLGILLYCGLTSCHHVRMFKQSLFVHLGANYTPFLFIDVIQSTNACAVKLKPFGTQTDTSERKARAGLRARLRVRNVGLTERSSGLSPLIWSGRMNSDIKDLPVGASLPVEQTELCSPDPHISRTELTSNVWQILKLQKSSWKLGLEHYSSSISFCLFMTAINKVHTHTKAQQSPSLLSYRLFIFHFTVHFEWFDQQSTTLSPSIHTWH